MKVGLPTSADLHWRFLGTMVGGDVVEKQEGSESMGLELWLQTGTTKHSLESISNSLMGTLSGTIPMERLTSSCFSLAPSSLKETTDLSTASKFTTKIKADTLVRNLRTKAMFGKPMVSEVNRRSFGMESFATEGPTLVINNKAAACLSIETLDRPQMAAPDS
jgi:hypothetical protein